MSTEPLKIVVVNAETGEIVEREMTDEEIASMPVAADFAADMAS